MAGRIRLISRRTIEEDATIVYDANIENIPAPTEEQWTLPDGHYLDELIEEYLYNPTDAAILCMVRIGKSKYDVAAILGMPRQSVDVRVKWIFGMLHAAWLVKEAETDTVIETIKKLLDHRERRIWKMFSWGVPIRRMSEAFDISYGGNCKETMYGLVQETKNKLSAGCGMAEYVELVNKLRRMLMTGLRR